MIQSPGLNIGSMLVPRTVITVLTRYFRFERSRDAIVRPSRSCIFEHLRGVIHILIYKIAARTEPIFVISLRNSPSTGYGIIGDSIS